MFKRGQDDCGDWTKHPKWDRSLIGKKFGKWTIVSKDETIPESVFFCKCDCSPDILHKINLALLKYGSTKSCGCLRNDFKPNWTLDLTGKDFGNLKVIKPVEGKRYNRRIIWECKCKCGRIKEVNTNFLMRGETTSCGECRSL